MLTQQNHFIIFHLPVIITILLGPFRYLFFAWFWLFLFSLSLSLSLVLSSVWFSYYISSHWRSASVFFFNWPDPVQLCWFSIPVAVGVLGRSCRKKRRPGPEPGVRLWWSPGCPGPFPDSLCPWLCKGGTAWSRHGGIKKKKKENHQTRRKQTE